MAGLVSQYKVVKHIFRTFLALGLTVFCLFAATVLSAQTDRHAKRLAKWTDISLPDTIRLQAADHLIRKSYWSSQPDSSLLMIEAQRELATEIEHPYWVARSLQNLGGLQLRLGDYEEAIQNLRQAQRLYEQYEQWYRAGQVAQALGNTLRKRGLVPEALEALLQSLSFHEQAGDRGRSGLAASLNSLGNLYLNQGDFEQAAENYEASLALHNVIGKEKGIAANLNNLSKVYTAWGKYSVARNFLDRSLAIKQQNNDLEGMANTYKNYGDIFLKWQQLDSAQLYYNRTLVLQDSLGLRGDAASSLADLGVVALAREDWTTARDYCSRGWEQATALGDLKVQVKNGDCLTIAHRKLEQPAAALDILEKTYVLKDSFLSASNTRELEAIRRAYEEEAAALQAAAGGTYTWWVMGALLSLVGWMFWFFWRQKRANKTAREPTNEMLVTTTPGSTAGQPIGFGSAVPGANEAADQQYVPEQSWANQVKARVRKELKNQREVTTSSLAQQLTTSERQLLRKCREETGQTTQQLVQETKLDYAKELLDGKQVLTVAELSRAVGFKSSSYFSQRFVARFGMRPSELLE